MPENTFFTEVYALQDKILKIVQSQRVDFYLTGGTALSRGYLNHRYSDDLDFFVNHVFDFKQQVNQVVSGLKRAGLKFKTGTVSDSFVRIFVCRDQTSIKIDFVNDVEFHYGDFKETDFFNRIDHWRNILSNKLCAISRLEPKDVADILFIAKNFLFSWPEVIEEANNKDLWVEPLEICRLLNAFRADFFDSVKWIHPVDKGKLSEQIYYMHDDIFYGRENSLLKQ